MFTCSISEKFNELKSMGLSPVCLVPTRNACAEINTEMLEKLGKQVVKLDARDTIDESKSNQQWSKKAQSELERLNVDCNLTAGLEATLYLAEGARVMLRRNLCTTSGLVNGSLGTVIWVKTSFVNIKFDHLPEPVTRED